MKVFPLVLGSIVFMLLLEESLSSSCEDTTQQLGNTPYISSSSRYSLGGNLRVPIPPHAKAGDLLILFLSRTDDVLPLELDGWTTGPSCFKEHNKGNHIQQCWTAKDCLESTTSNTSSGGIKYCTRFPYNHTGEDLATIVFHKPVADEEENLMFHVNLPGIHPAWATLAAISDVNMTHPIRSSRGVSCDKKAAGVFPTVHGKAGDLLLLSMAHDDPANQTAFQAPLGTRLVQEQHGIDETGYLFARRLNFTGKTPKYATKGEGTQWWCKDALLSLVIRMLPSDDGNNKTLIDNELVLLDETDVHCRDSWYYSTAIMVADIFSWLMNIERWKTKGPLFLARSWFS